MRKYLILDSIICNRVPPSKALVRFFGSYDDDKDIGDDDDDDDDDDGDNGIDRVKVQERKRNHPHKYIIFLSSVYSPDCRNIQISHYNTYFTGRRVKRKINATVVEKLSPINFPGSQLLLFD